MKKSLFIVSIIAITMLASCKKECACSQNWDSTITYVEDDLVLYNGTCWIAVGQGKGIESGPWLANGNDIWEECTD